MDCTTLEDLLKKELNLTYVKAVDDAAHFEIILVGECFEGKSLVQKQQLVYKPLMESIQNGIIHAVNMKTFTPTEWERDKIFYS